MESGKRIQIASKGLRMKETISFHKVPVSLGYTTVQITEQEGNLCPGQLTMFYTNTHTHTNTHTRKHTHAHTHTHTHTRKHTQSASIWKYSWPLINSMNCITEYYCTKASGKEMATERARKRERERERGRRGGGMREIRRRYESRTKGAIGDIVFGMH